MELRRLLSQSLLLVLVVIVDAAWSLVCHCTGSHHPECFLYMSLTCAEGDHCAIMFKKDIESTSQAPNPRFTCSSDFVQELGPGVCSGAFNNATLYIACCNEDMCNEKDRFEPVYADPVTTTTTFTTTTTTNTPLTTGNGDPETAGLPATGSSAGNWNVYIGLVVGLPIVLVTGVLILLLLSYLYYRHLKREVSCTVSQPKWESVRQSSLASVNVDFKCTISGTDEGTMTCTSGSGSGLPLLAHRTVAKSIKLGERIGSGRFGQVYVGDYRGEKVAVKKFVSHDDKSWARETEIYNTVYLINDNILGFFASDMVSNNGVTELWLITHYHPNGSLYDYLNLEVVSVDVMTRMISSCCKGLAHLHTELPGMCGKPAIAHRDIKSRNILVKNNLECCIADFGLSVMKDGNGLSLPTNPRQGTKRYMAPEILDESINMERFESFKQADVYSLGLIMWEICRRCTLKDGIAVEYEAPFQGLVPPDPSFEDMKRLVVEMKKTPPIQPEWKEDKRLQRLSRMMQECWYFNAAARPTAINLKKRIIKLLDEKDSLLPIQISE